ncbi:T9SS type A sorting domain-containing protein [bacterium SCSIO 12741]|nr:T9SS type A sorting domain-containing protein [bacterium SCSIO 12741]
MKKTVFISFILIFLGAFPLRSLAQIDQWELLTDQYRNVTLRDMDASGDTLIAVGPDISTFTPHILRSFDDGRSWDTLQVGNGPLLRSIQFSDQNHAVIGSVNTFSCVLRTSDAGHNWEWMWCDLDSNFTGINQIEFFDEQHAYMFGWGRDAFTSGCMYETTDGGVSWAHVKGNLPDQPIEFAQFLSPQQGYTGSFLFGHSLLFRTIDGGQSWQECTAVDSMSFTAAYFHDIQRGFMSTMDGIIWATHDSGHTWTEVHTDSNAYFMGIEFANEKYGVAVGNEYSGRSQPVIAYTTDGGTTWKRVDNMPAHFQLQKAKFTSDRFYVVSGSGEVLRSGKVDLTTSTTDVQKEEFELKLFPNPTPVGNRVEIPTEWSGWVDIKVLNNLGERVGQLRLHEGEREIQANYEPGIYFLQISHEQGSHSIKWVIR